MPQSFAPHRGPHPARVRNERTLTRRAARKGRADFDLADAFRPARRAALLGEEAGRAVVPPTAGRARPRPVRPLPPVLRRPCRRVGHPEGRLGQRHRPVHRVARQGFRRPRRVLGAAAASRLGPVRVGPVAADEPEQRLAPADADRWRRPEAFRPCARQVAARRPARRQGRNHRRFHERRATAPAVQEARRRAQRRPHGLLLVRPTLRSSHRRL